MLPVGRQAVSPHVLWEPGSFHLPEKMSLGLRVSDPRLIPVLLLMAQAEVPQAWITTDTKSYSRPEILAVIPTEPGLMFQGVLCSASQNCPCPLFFRLRNPPPQSASPVEFQCCFRFTRQGHCHAAGLPL